MARTRATAPKTPQEQVIVSDAEEEEDDVNEGAMEPSSDGPVHDGTVNLTVQDLPDGILDFADVPASSPPRVNATADMGNEQSREATNAALHNTSNALLNERKTRAKTGTLRRPTTTVPVDSNPAYRNPVKNQRKLAPQSNNRLDTYDVPQSDDERSPPNKRKAQQQPVISPRRSQRKKAKAAHEQADDVAAEAEQDDDAGDNIDVFQPRAASAEVEAAAAGGAEEEQPAATEVLPKPKAKGKRGRPPKESASSEVIKSPRRSKSQRQTRAGRTRATGEDANEADGIEQPDNAADGDFVPDEDGNDENGDDGVAQHAEHARVSQLFPHDKSALELSSSDGPGQSKRSSKRSKSQQNASKSAAQANTSRKRKRHESDVAADGVLADDDEGRDTKLWLHGQFDHLRMVLQNLRYVGYSLRTRTDKKGNKTTVKSHDKPDLDDVDVETIIDLCQEARCRFRALRRQDAVPDADSDPASVLTDISERVEGLRGRSEEYETDFESRDKCTAIYAHLIPKLVKLLWSAAMCYIEIDKDEVSAGQVKVGHLQTVLQLTKMILDLERTAENKYKKRPSSDLAIVKPVHNRIAVPLRDIYSALDRTYQKYYEGIRNERRKEYEANYDADRRERQAQEKKQQARLREVQKKWEILHDERLLAETGIIRPDKRIHLQMPSHDIIEYDQNGDSFTRAEGFLPRVGPNPSMIAEAASLYWTTEELEALVDGLKAYAGSRVFESIFRKHCGRGKPLNSFNVTEIVTTAAKFKELETENQMSLYGDVEDWVTSIPVWTKGQMVAPGQENEDSVVNLAAEASEQ